ncbi:MAG: tripartite tricarboxylate transporter substrate binding protein [Burkholderiales bacterium]|jgi:tripartite-type tricarboxylate transporter receptor subunit TctC|nr:tripartite tricarboxylate transporter substrate binding protein [Burkholderiales bacterium]
MSAARRAATTTAAASILAAILAAIGGAPAAHAGWPDKPVRIVVPFPPGGSTDSVARLSAEWLARTLGQPVTVENRTGASGTIAAEFVAQAPADGHTLFMASLAQMSIVPQMGKVRYDPFKSFVPISVISTSFFALAVHPSLPAKNVQQLVALAKTRPAQLAYGSSGNGSAAHLTMALFLQRAGVKMVHVPYKGVAPAIADLIGGHVPMVFGSVSEVLRHYKGGKLRVLGVSSDRRLDQMPEVPTVAEQGFPGYLVSTWNGLVAPAGTPKEVLSVLYNAIRPACKDAGFIGKFDAMDANAWCSTPQEFADMLRADWAKWGDAVKFAGATLE